MGSSTHCRLSVGLQSAPLAKTLFFDIVARACLHVVAWAAQVVEHVEDPLAFVHTLTALCAPQAATPPPTPPARDASPSAAPPHHPSHGSHSCASGAQPLEATAHVAGAAGHPSHHIPPVMPSVMQSDAQQGSGEQLDRAGEMGAEVGSAEGAAKREGGQLPSSHPQQHSGVAGAPPSAAAASEAAGGGGGGGVLVLSTLNRTARSYALAILAAEHVLSMVCTAQGSAGHRAAQGTGDTG